jgi:hypothetical protein
MARAQVSLTAAHATSVEYERGRLRVEEARLDSEIARLEVELHLRVDH